MRGRGINSLRTAMKRDHWQGQQIEDEEERQRENEREERAWQEYLENEKEQSKKQTNE